MPGEKNNNSYESHRLANDGKHPAKTITSAAKVAQTRAYHAELSQPSTEYAETRVAKLKAKYPLADTAPLTGTKKKKF